MRRSLDAFEADPFDLVILGGGITGAGVALDAVLRGLRVALLEKNDFASGTSSISSKLVHGGLRYLEQGQLHLVYEALHERRRLLHNAPHLVWPLRFIVPFYTDSRVPPWMWRLGLLTYDILAGTDNLRRSRALARERLGQEFPALDGRGLVGGGEYTDAQMDDARLCLEVIRSAALRGAVVANHLEAIALGRVGGLIREVRAVDRLTGREVKIRGEVVLNATGPWSDRVRHLAAEEGENLLEPTKGVHLVAPCRQLSAAFVLLHPRDGRVFFVLPWLGKTLLGTTDTECSGSPDELVVTDEDIAYLLEGFNRYFHPGLERQDLLGHFVGVRPLARSRPRDPSARSREHRIVVGASGLISVVGGKWTTYRRMAEEITDTVLRRLGRSERCRTRNYHLDGAPRIPWQEFHREAVATLRSRHEMSEATAKHLVGRYGRRVGAVAAYLKDRPELGEPIVAGEPDVRAELEYQRDQEMALGQEDHFLRRTRLGLFYPRLLLPEK